MWTSAAGARGTTINQVRLRGTGGLDPLSARLRASRAIEHAAAGIALPAGAILCVRRLLDPRPGRVSLNTLQSPPAEWAHAVTERLGDLSRRAARPAHGEAAALDAEAVIFDDGAQLLACLAADWCRGSMAACWWWRTLLGTSSEAEAVLRAWLSRPAHIAAAIKEATRLGVAAAFVARLSERHTSMLLEAVVAAHGLDRQLASAQAIHSFPAPSPHAVLYTPPARPPVRIQHDPRGAVLPWSECAPEACSTSLRADQQQFLGIALTVERDPARARDPIFVDRVVRWRQAVVAGNNMVPVAPTPAARTPIRVGTQSDEAIAPAESAASREDVEPSATLDAPVAATLTAFPLPSSPDLRGAHREERRAGVPMVSADPVPDEPIQGDRSVCRMPTAVPASIETQLGGIFYLLNVALALGLYGDFTAPKGPRLELSIWQFIALVGGALLRGRHRRDPVWSLLADLAGPPPHAFSGTPTWRLDPAWLASFPARRTWRWSADADRIRVRHPAGFAIIDVPQSRERTAVQQVQDHVEPYRTVSSFRLVRGTTRTRTEPAFARWTRWHAAYVRARLARALAAPRSHVGPLLCRHRARIYLSLTHVEIAFSLCALPIAIRLSGLDRDPGWIPAADRIVSFRYD
jgi:hypothetical protein